MTPDQELHAAAKRLEAVDDANWRGTPLHVLFPGIIRLLTEYGDDWDQCPEDHPGHTLDDAALSLAQKINHHAAQLAATVKPSPPARPAAPSADLIPHGEPIDIGWRGGSLDARLHLYVRPGMDPIERDQLIADLRKALGAVVPVLPVRSGEAS
ncbi:hypothetical protein [Streptomyces sp. NPDC055642]